jgi:hypothetical protein
MPERKSNSRVLRNLAEEMFEVFATEGEISEAERDDFITSMIRQWITYDGNATWFFGEEQVNFTHRRTPLGKSLLTTKRSVVTWFVIARVSRKCLPTPTSLLSCNAPDGEFAADALKRVPVLLSNGLGEADVRTPSQSR